jgi:uncharacterized membrane protein YtjA (UPF0391 family)
MYFIERSIREGKLLSWALAFLLIAIVAAVLGFGGLASTATGMADILFCVFLLAFIISLLVNFSRGRAH